MPPTQENTEEADLLSSFLLAPAPLPSILSLQNFTDLFPRAQRSNPQILHLYRSLQDTRALEIERVKRNIAHEVKRGEKQRRQVIKTRRRGILPEENEPARKRTKIAPQVEVSTSLLIPSVYIERSPVAPRTPP